MFRPPSKAGPGNGLASGTALVYRESAPGGGVTRLFMQQDGKLVLYTPTSHATWSSRTAGRGPLTWVTRYRGAFFIETVGKDTVCDFETAPSPC